MGPNGQVVHTELVSPNELKLIKKAGLRAAVREATTLLHRRTEALDRNSPVPIEHTAAVLDQTNLSLDISQVNLSIVEAVLRTASPLSHTGGATPAVPTDLAEGTWPRADNPEAPLNAVENIQRWTNDILLQLGNPNNILEDQTLHTQIPMSHTEITLAVCDIHVDWDNLGDSSYSSPSKELAMLVCTKLGRAFSEGKDSLLKAISDDNADDVAKILDVAKEAMMIGAEGYTKYESLEPFRTLNDP